MATKIAVSDKIAQVLREKLVSGGAITGEEMERRFRSTDAAASVRFEGARLATS